MPTNDQAAGRESLGEACSQTDMHKNDSDKAMNRGRRKLLIGAVAAGASATLPLAEGVPNTEPSLDRRSMTYRETEHIRQAYRRMRF